VVLGPSTAVGIAEIRERDRDETMRLWLKPMTCARKIDAKTDGRTAERAVEKIVGWIVVRIGNLTDEKIAGKIVSPTGVKIDKLIGARIIALMQAVNFAGSIGLIMWPENMVGRGERMPV
jgi:hypothetical protein